jgi:hypothetical protein
VAVVFRLTFLVFFLLGAQFAHALIPPINGWQATWRGKTTGVYPDKASACTAPEMQALIAADLAGSTQFSAGGLFFQDPLCRTWATRTSNGERIEGGGPDLLGVPGACPAYSVSVQGGCQCSGGYVENSSQTACNAPPDTCLALKGGIVGEIEWASVTKGNYNGCLGGTGSNAMCQTVAVCDYTSQVPGQSGYTCRGNSYMTGGRAASCTGNGEAVGTPGPAPVVDPVKPDKVPVAGQPAPARCPAGQAPGDFNGSRICVPTGSGTETSTPAPGNGSSTVTNSDGSSTTSTQSGRTTCLNGKCTTTTENTTTNVNAAGNSTCPEGQTVGTTTVAGQSRTTCTKTSSSSTTEAQSSFCEKNSKDKQCDGDGADTAFGGTCASGFKAVSDDAVINAMAEEQYRRNCQFFEKTPEATEESSAYDEMKAKAKAGTDLTDGMDSRFKRSVSIGPADFDSSSAIGVSACIRDVPIVMSGLTITLPFSRVCPYLEYIGTLLTVVAYLLAARIVVRG